jgi:hypothetical protein
MSGNHTQVMQGMGVCLEIVWQQSKKWDCMIEEYMSEEGWRLLVAKAPVLDAVL